MSRLRQAALLPIAVALGCVLFFSANSGLSAEAPKKSETRTDASPPSASGRLESPCGDEMVFDRNSGRMIKRNRVDLVVEKVELKRTAGREGVAVKPTIRNRCPDSTKKNFEVSIQDVVVPFGTLAGNSSYTLGHWILVGEATSIEVEADWDDGIKETHEGNNTCTAAFPAGETSKIHRCR